MQREPDWQATETSAWPASIVAAAGVPTFAGSKLSERPAPSTATHRVVRQLSPVSLCPASIVLTCAASVSPGSKLISRPPRSTEKQLVVDTQATPASGTAASTMCRAGAAEPPKATSWPRVSMALHAVFERQATADKAVVPSIVCALGDPGAAGSKENARPASSTAQQRL